MIERHIELERKTIQFVREAPSALKSSKMVVQEYLPDYHLIDEGNITGYSKRRPLS